MIWIDAGPGFWQVPMFWGIRELVDLYYESWAEELSQQAWIEDVKERLGLVTIPEL